MWHAFDIMGDQLAAPDATRSTHLPTACRLVYGQRIIRWFKDKASSEQWPPTVDHLPGMVISKRLADDNSINLEVQQRWQHSVDHLLEGTLACSTSAWRSPRAWNFRQVFKIRGGSAPVAPLAEQGRWDGSTLTRTTSGSAGKSVRTDKVAAMTCTYSLLADFPLAEAKSGALPPAALLSDGLLLAQDASFAKCEGAPEQDKLAAGLTGISINSSNGFPMEFWVNERGTVVYMLAGPLRAFVLEKVEALT